MPDETYVTRREIDILKAEADRERAKMWVKIDALDEHGSRGIAPVAVQLAEVIKDVADLKREVEHRFDTHEEKHDKEEARRVSSRRWLVGAIIAAVAAVDGPVVTIFLARGR